jgi:hypothetical protein
MTRPLLWRQPAHHFSICTEGWDGLKELIGYMQSDCSCRKARSSLFRDKTLLSNFRGPRVKRIIVQYGVKRWSSLVVQVANLQNEGDFFPSNPNSVKAIF